MKKVFIIHGFKGEPNGGWRPWLMGELAKKDIYACALPMPKPDTPNKEEWVETIKNAVGEPSEEIFLVGHSLGVPAILRYLETLPSGSKIGGVVLVSGIIYEIKESGHDSLNSFLNKPFDFETIKNVCKNFVVIHGDNDTAVSFKEGENLSQILSCELIPIHNGKHLNGSASWYELPQALDSLLKIIKS
jgi:hypothetical protein